ncbi:MAG TPA: TraY domain-containing protein [Alphaproteobacteria bacterium]|nr:TraY domain-containing protein [Alphaproteobacteria bacterium]
MRRVSCTKISAQQVIEELRQAAERNGRSPEAEAQARVDEAAEALRRFQLTAKTRGELPPT